MGAIFGGGKPSTPSQPAAAPRPPKPAPVTQKVADPRSRTRFAGAQSRKELADAANTAKKMLLGQ